MTDVVAKTIQNARSLLSRWSTGSASIATFSANHWRLTLRITRPDRSGCLELQFGDTQWFCGPLHWNGCAIEVAHRNLVHSDESGFIASDVNAGVVIESVVLEVKEFDQLA